VTIFNHWELRHLAQLYKTFFVIFYVNIDVNNLYFDIDENFDEKSFIGFGPFLSEQSSCSEVKSVGYLQKLFVDVLLQKNSNDYNSDVGGLAF
jgi:hypothetical protein